MREFFFQSEQDQPHPARARAIIKSHPEVRRLMERNPYTGLIAFSVVALQTAIAYGVGKLGVSYWWLSLLLAYGIGAFANHANYVIVHDATHNLIFRRRSWNRLTAILDDLPNLTPGAMGFWVYHLRHHSHQGDYEWDADLANHWEARLVGNKWYRKALWLTFFPIFQLTRPPRLRAIKMWDRWFSLNLVAAILYDVGVVRSGFWVYHLRHHSHQGDYEWDADLANHWEARLVGNKWYRKALWLTFFPIFQLTRPPRLRAIKMWDRWFSLNLVAAILYDVGVV